MPSAQDIYKWTCAQKQFLAAKVWAISQLRGYFFTLYYHQSIGRKGLKAKNEKLLKESKAWHKTKYLGP